MTALHFQDHAYGVPKRFQSVDYAEDVERSQLPDKLLDLADEWLEEVEMSLAEWNALPDTNRMLRMGQGESWDVPDWGLFLSGAPGVGKSWLCAALVNHAARLGAHTFWISAQNLVSMYYRKMELSDIIKKLSVLDDNTPELIEKRSRDRILWQIRNEFQVVVIDDLGRERETGSGFVSGILDEVIRTRVDNGLCTHITTNLLLSQDQLASRYGEPLQSLLKEVSKAYELKGHEDYRETIAEERAR